MGVLPRPPAAALRPHRRGYLSYRYLIALGSNRRHHQFGRPRDVIAAALKTIADEGAAVRAVAPVYVTAPIGPSLRRYANSAAIVETALDPPTLLALLKRIERRFGRRASGQRWTSRVLDLDVILWSGGAFAAPGLVVPHRLFRERDFVLAPAVAVAPRWRDPVTGLTVRQLRSRLTRRKRLRR